MFCAVRRNLETQRLRRDYPTPAYAINQIPLRIATFVANFNAISQTPSHHLSPPYIALRIMVIASAHPIAGRILELLRLLSGRTVDELCDLSVILCIQSLSTLSTRYILYEFICPQT